MLRPVSRRSPSGPPAGPARAAGLALAACLAPSAADALALDLTGGGLEFDGGALSTTVAAGDGTEIDFTLRAVDMSGGAADLSRGDDVASGACGTLGCTHDGIGVNGSDEIFGSHKFVLESSELIEVTSVFLLDLFADPDSDEAERALIDFDDDGEIDGEVSGSEDFVRGRTGYVEGDMSEVEGRVTDSISLLVGEPGNDGAGVSDFALAGLGFELFEGGDQDIGGDLDTGTEGVTPIPLGGSSVFLLSLVLGAVPVLRHRSARSA